MLQDRISDEYDDENNKTLKYLVAKLQQVGPQEFEAICGSKTIFSLTVDSKLKIIYFLQRFLTKDIKKHISKADEDNDTTKYIVVMKDKSTNTNIRSLHEHFANIGVGKANIEVFELKELIFNISKHALVPKHTLISAARETEIDEILKSVNVKSKIQLPVILRTDPMSRYLDARPGDIIKILRYPVTSAEHIFYRICM
jgi:DNA-directed RNA polymerase I, II, and III subunit RPABC1